MTTTIGGVQVSLCRDEENFRKIAITIAVRSTTKKGVLSKTSIDPGKATNHAHLIQLISTAASAGAEYLGEKYGDDLDPASCGSSAIKAFGHECRLIQALQEEASAKVKKLEQNAGYLQDNEKEILFKLSWAIRNSRKITAQDADWVNKVLSRVYSQANS